VIEGAERGAGNHDNGVTEVAGPGGDVIAGSEGDAPTADAFHGEMGEAFLERGDAAVFGGEIDGAVFGGGGDERSGGGGEVVRVDFVEGERGGGGGLEDFGVGAVAGGEGFEGGGGVALGAPAADEPGSEVGFAHAGIGAGDEEGGHGF
jgi:hypothetical protein